MGKASRRKRERPPVVKKDEYDEPMIKSDKGPPKKSSLGHAVGIGALMIAIGLWITWMGAQGYFSAEAPEWVEVQAEVLTSEFEETLQRRKGDGPEAPEFRVFVPHIRYRYYHEGVWHTSDKWRQYGTPIERKEMVQGLLARFPVGKKVTAYVDPEKRVQTVLIPQERTSFILFMGLGLFTIVIGVTIGGAGLILLKQRKAIKKKRS